MTDDMNSENPSPETQPSDVSTETDLSFRQRMDDFYKDLTDHPWVNSRLLHVSWMSNIREKADAEYEWTVKLALAAFESSKAISMENKELIRKTIHDSIAHINAYEAFAGTGLVSWLYILISLLGFLELILSGLIWHPVQRGFLEWVGFYTVAIFVFALILSSIYKLRSLVFRLVNRPMSNKVRKLTYYNLVIICTYVPPYLLFSWSQLFVWGDSFAWLGNAITVGSLSGTIVASLIIMVSIFVVVEYRYKRSIRLRRFSKAEFISKSLDMFIRLDDTGYFLAKPVGFVQYFESSPMVNDLESMSLSLEYLLTQNSNNYDTYTQAWLEQNSTQIANDVRRLKQLVLLPGEDTRQQMMDTIAQKLILVAQGYYGQLERYEMPPLQTRRVLLVIWLHKTMSLVIPIALIIAVQLLPFEFDIALKNSLVTLGVGWVVVAILNLIDPAALNQIKEGSNLLSMFKKDS